MLYRYWFKLNQLRNYVYKPIKKRKRIFLLNVQIYIIYTNLVKFGLLYSRRIIVQFCIYITKRKKKKKKEHESCRDNINLNSDTIF